MNTEALEARADAAEKKLLDDVDELERRGRQIERVVVRTSPVTIMLAALLVIALGSNVYAAGKRYVRRRRSLRYRFARALKAYG